MRDDDTPVGRLLSRREVVAVFGATGAAWLAGGAFGRTGWAGSQSPGPSCVVRPEQTEGPYFVDGDLLRSDIRSDPADGQMKLGTPLALTLLVSRLSGGQCEPLPDAQMDIWQCDALGIYSGVRDPNFDTVGQKFLRGYQVTDAGGQVRFTTLYPGAYRGRAVHIHFKIRTDPAARRGHEFISQLYFDDALTDRVHAADPYAENGRDRTRNPEDGIFRSGGDQLLLSPTETADGYAASFALGLQLP